MLSSEEDGPRDPAGVLFLQEERLGFAVLEAEDFAVPADEELTLRNNYQSFTCLVAMVGAREYGADGIALGGRNTNHLPCQGRSLYRQRYRRRYA